MKSYTITTQPSAEPVSIAEAVAFLRSTGDATEAATIAALIATAREMVEDFTGRALLSTQFLCVASDFAGRDLTWHGNELTLDRSPLVSVQSVKYIAEGATSETTMDPADYAVITTTTPGRVLFLTDSLPVLAERPDAVRVAFTAGNASAESVKASLRHAILLLVAHLYENRAAALPQSVNELPLGLRHLLESHRIGGFVA